MGIRFACHHCGKRLNIKRELAGKRGICPACATRFRIPLSDATTSLPVDQKPQPQPQDHAAIQNGSFSPSNTANDAPDAKTGAETPLSKEPLANEPDEHTPRQDQPFAVAQGHELASRGGASGDEPHVASPGGASSVLQEAVSAAAILNHHEPEATWYVRPPSGGQYGPASTELLCQWIEQGRVAAASLLWRDGWPQWRSAAEALPEVAGQLPGGDQPGGTERLRGGDLPHRGATAVGATASGKSLGSAASSAGPAVAGQADLGSQRRIRSSRRVFWIGVLAAVAIFLIGALVVVASR
jgi:hypothetical protein